MHCSAVKEKSRILNRKNSIEGEIWDRDVLGNFAYSFGIVLAESHMIIT